MINFTGGAAVCGIIGNPVSQSLSPLLHRIFAAEEGRDFVYVPLHVRSRLKEAIAGAHALGIRGMNILSYNLHTPVLLVVQRIMY